MYTIFARRLDIHVNSRLRFEMPDTSVIRLRSSLPTGQAGVPIEKEYRVTGKEEYIHKKNQVTVSQTRFWLPPGNSQNSGYWCRRPLV